MNKHINESEFAGVSYIVPIPDVYMMNIYLASCTILRPTIGLPRTKFASMQQAQLASAVLPLQCVHKAVCGILERDDDV